MNSASRCLRSMFQLQFSVGFGSYFYSFPFICAVLPLSEAALWIERLGRFKHPFVGKLSPSTYRMVYKAKFLPNVYSAQAAGGAR